MLLLGILVHHDGIAGFGHMVGRRVVGERHDAVIILRVRYRHRRIWYGGIVIWEVAI